MASEKATILAIDDTPDNLMLISALLKEHYTVKIATQGETGLKIAANSPPDLILLDIMMPGIDGYEVCKRLKADPKTRDIPVIFLTAKSEEEDETKGLELGAADYVTKPLSPTILGMRIKNHLALKTTSDFLRNQAEFLAQEVSRRTQEITAIQDVTILAMASLAETRDVETGNHIRRTQHYVKALADKLKTHPDFGWYLSEEMIGRLFKSAPLHDIGKVGIPDRILLKPAALSVEEFDIMKTHTILGGNAIEHAERALGAEVAFLNCAKEIAYFHQEKWDGSGYPEGRVGADIPISARLMAVADVYDALISRRVYKEPVTHEEAVVAMLEGRGTHFDPEVLDAFVEIQDEFKEIAERFADTDNDLIRKVDDIREAVGS